MSYANVGPTTCLRILGEPFKFLFYEVLSTFSYFSDYFDMKS